MQSVVHKFANDGISLHAIFAVWALLVVPLLAGQEPSEKAPMKSGLSGTWRGVGIEMVVTPNGANVEFGCASGTIDQPIVPDEEGKFDLPGKWIAQHAGPIRRNEEMSGQAARYAGAMKDKVMTLTVTLADKDQSIGTFELELNGSTLLKKCK